MIPPFAALIGAWLLNAAWPLVAADGLKFFSVVLFMHGGILIGLAVLLPWLVPAERRRWIWRMQTFKPLLMITLVNGLASLIYLKAVCYTTPANAAVMAQSEVLYSAVLSVLFLGESIGPAQVAASLLVMTGTGLIMIHDLGSLRWKGDLMIAATPWMYQVGHVMAKRLPKDFDPVTMSAIRLLYAAILMIPLSWWVLAHGGRWEFSGPAVSILLAQGVFINALALSLWYLAILRMDLAKSTAFLLSYPALTMTFSWLLGFEKISAIQVAGLAVTLSGAWWLSRLHLNGVRH